MRSFFFFFFEKPVCEKIGLLFRKTKPQWMSKATRETMSSGRETVQTRDSLENLAFLVRASATMLQRLVLKINLWEEIAVAWVWISSIMWP